jgi:hypothetical protein
MRNLMAIINGGICLYALILSFRSPPSSTMNFQDGLPYPIVAIIFALNAVLLWDALPGRLGRLTSLWFDAKEAGLKAKIAKSSQQSSKDSPWGS